MVYRPFVAALCAFTISSVASFAYAGTETTTTGKEIKNVAPVELLPKGTTEIELLGGYFHSPVLATGGSRPEFDYAGADARVGKVLTDPILADTFLKGNFEMLLDVLGYGVTSGPGSYLVGGSLLFRYNFLAAGHIIPYFQLGGGGLHSDAVEDQSQRLIGADFEFILEAEVGVRIPINDKWSVRLEGGFEHISNADTAARNVGVNALGGRLGLGYTF
jgi:lipid A 3-O-deacylase